jgi:hypothetical protein
MSSIQKNKKAKVIALRASLVVLYFVLLAVFLISGRTHTVLIDNKADPDGAWQAIRGMTVSVNGGKAVEYMRGDRDKETIKGQKMKVRVEFFDGSDPAEFTLYVPFIEDTLLLSVPKLVQGLANPLEPFNLYADNKAQTDAEEGERFGQE